MKNKLFDKGSPARFVVLFLALFVCFYYFNIFFFGITSPGNHYSSFIDKHLNYIRGLRQLLLNSSAAVLNLFGFTSITSDTEILITGHGKLKVVYSCLGLGVISFLTAFVLAYPKKLRSKIIFLISGIIVIEILNVLRFVILGIFWDKNTNTQLVDHHTLFNIFIYIVIAISIYFWVKSNDKITPAHAKN
jgi:exosortase/archaeosortase family protein